MFDWFWKRLFPKDEEDDSFSPLHDFIMVDRFDWPLEEIVSEAEVCWRRRNEMLGYPDPDKVDIKLTNQKDDIIDGKKVKKYHFEVWRKK